MPTVPSKYSKRNDTGEAVRGQCVDANGPVDLRGRTCRFLARKVAGGIETIIDSGSGDGIVIVEEDESGLEEDRGWWRFEPTDQGVDVDGTFEIELEVVIDAGPPVKRLTWPSKAAENPSWQIDPDIPYAS